MDPIEEEDGETQEEGESGVASDEEKGDDTEASDREGKS